jgi:hypothetical protein
MINAITNLTGYTPIIWEPFDNTNGGYNTPGLAYNAGGSYGGLQPYNFWIWVYVNANTLYSYGGYNDPSFGYNAGGAYSGGIIYSFTYDQILSVVNRVKLGGTVPHLTLIYV